MVKNGGNYYPSLEEISIVGRLVADMSKDNDAGEAEYRGSINDVEAVSDAIDGTAISHSASADVDQPEGSFSVIDRVIARRLDLDLLALLPVRRVFLTI